ADPTRGARSFSDGGQSSHDSDESSAENVPTPPVVRRPGFSIGSRAGARPAERRRSRLSGSSTSSSGQAVVDDPDAATLHRDGARAPQLRQRSGDPLTDGAQARGDVVARPGKIEDVAAGAPRFHRGAAAQPSRHVAEREILDQRSEPAQASTAMTPNATSGRRRQR